MPALPATQQSDWDNNVYVFATTRVSVMILLAYLIKSLCSIVPLVWGTRSDSVPSVVADGIDLENIVSDTQVTIHEAASTGPNLEINPTLEVRRPRPIYNPQNHTEGSRANARAQYQGLEASGQPAVAQAMSEQEDDLRNSDHHMEEDMDVTVSDARRETSIESVVDEEIGVTPTQSRGDAIRLSLDA